MTNFKRKEIYEFKCCNEGRLVIQEKDKDNRLICINQDRFDTDGRVTHLFLILSPEEYCNNPKTHYISVLPITSSKKNYTVSYLF